MYVCINKNDYFNIVKIIEKLISETKRINYKIDILIENSNESICTIKDLEFVTVKILKEVKMKLESFFEKFSLKAYLENGKYSYPNFVVGNIELGFSRNPIALLWPSMQKSSKEKLLES